jgi:hypothetical protein
MWINETGLFQLGIGKNFYAELGIGYLTGNE